MNALKPIFNMPPQAVVNFWIAELEPFTDSVRALRTEGFLFSFIYSIKSGNY